MMRAAKQPPPASSVLEVAKHVQEKVAALSPLGERTAPLSPLAPEGGEGGGEGAVTRHHGLPAEKIGLNVTAKPRVIWCTRPLDIVQNPVLEVPTALPSIECENAVKNLDIVRKA